MDRFTCNILTPLNFKDILGDPEVTANHATFPIWLRKITVQICGNFWVTQYIYRCMQGTERKTDRKIELEMVTEPETES